MLARRYRFHCTDGQDAVFDRTGRLVQRQRELRDHAAVVARRMMAGGMPEFDWSDWIVDVHDPVGRRRMMLAFAEVRRAGTSNSRLQERWFRISTSGA